MGIKDRQLAQKERLRRSILDAAAELFVKEGYEKVSMRRLAEKIDYSPMSIYLHFRDKAELLDTICEETFTTLIQHKRLARAEDYPGDPIGYLKAGLRAYIEFGLRHPYHYQLTFMTRSSVDGERRKRIGQEAFGCLRTAVRTCAEQGKLRIDDVELASQVLWTAIHGVTSLLITHSKFPWANRERLIGEAVDTVVRGLERDSQSV
ncbi:MAG TPA: TetR/AcrR family transcriptional regulator [bacterium]|nr:TetR/AcrR family transcriptional regulator [bacterium]